MKKVSSKVTPHIVPMTIVEFLESYNKNMPESYPHVSLAILQRFKDEHPSLFKSNGFWSLDQHRKRMIEWLPQNI